MELDVKTSQELNELQSSINQIQAQINTIITVFRRCNGIKDDEKMKIEYDQEKKVYRLEKEEEKE